MANTLGGTVIGTAGTTGNGPGNAFDGNLTTFYDSPSGSGGWTGLDLGSGYSITGVSYCPRSSWANRMVGGQFQGSNASDFSTGATTFYTVPSAPPQGQLTVATFAAVGPFRYVRYLSPQYSYANVAEIQFSGTAATGQLTGSTIGTAGTTGNGPGNAFDGNLTTFFDSPLGSGGWAGLDLGSAYNVSGVSYCPRTNWANRMVGGQFQGSNAADFSSGVTTLYTVPSAPSEGQLTSATFTAAGPFRYVRYLSPQYSYANVAEVQFFGPGSAAPPAPQVGIVGGTNVSPTATFDAGPAPAIAWLDISGVTSVRGDRRLWHTHAGAPAATDPRHTADATAYPTSTVDPDNSRVGPVVAIPYEAAGTYQVTCDVTHADATTVTYGITVTVDADTRPHYYFASTGSDHNAGTSPTQAFVSASKFASLCAGGNCRISVQAPMTLTLTAASPASVNVGSNVVIEGMRDGSGNRPVLKATGTPVFYVGSSGSNVLIRGFKFDSDGTTSGGLTHAPTVTIGGSNYRSEPLQSSGRNVAVIDCEFACLTQGPQLFGGDLAVSNCVQSNASTMNGQVVVAYGPGRYVVAYNSFAGAFAEANVRTDGPSGGQSGSIEWNLLAQNPATGNTKASCDLRSADGIVVAYNGFRDAQTSMSSSVNTPNTVTEDILVLGNVYRTDQSVPFTGWVEVKSRATAVTITGNDFGTPVANTVDQNAGLTDIVVSGNNR